jgi:hypothetical protein
MQPLRPPAISKIPRVAGSRETPTPKDLPLRAGGPRYVQVLGAVGLRTGTAGLIFVLFALIQATLLTTLLTLSSALLILLVLALGITVLVLTLLVLILALLVLLTTCFVTVGPVLILTRLILALLVTIFISHEMLPCCNAP